VSGGALVAGTRRGRAGASFSALLAGKRHQSLEVTGIATHAKEPVFEATAFEIRFKFLMDMSGKIFALTFQLLNQGGVVFL
tara:strand:- start:383 stop:625 length:243 start_codon:yes stop_codon:yes gene_type:complete